MFGPTCSCMPTGYLPHSDRALMPPLSSTPPISHPIPPHTPPTHGLHRSHQRAAPTATGARQRAPPFSISSVPQPRAALGA